MLAIVAAHLILVAQLSDASVTGIIRDASSGAPLIGASVAINGSMRAVVSDAAGRFAVNSVPVGSHHMTVRCFGHASRSIELLVPRQGTVSIDIALEPVATRLAPVAVFPDAESDGADGLGRVTIGDRVVTPASLAQHPLLAEPDVLRAVSGGEVFARPETAGGLFVRGGSSDQVAYSLDGIPVFNVAHLGGLLGAWNTDALSGARLSLNAQNMRAPSVLSGSLEATTRAPGDVFSVRGAVSSTQLRLTAAGPLAGAKSGYLFSMRQAVPTLGASSDRNLVRGESGDWLGKLSVSLAHGTLSLLAYGSGDDFTSSRVVAPLTTSAARNGFAWESRSIGASWLRVLAHSDVRATAWQATTHATADWNTATSDARLDARRTDYGVQVVRQPTPDRSGTTLSARVELMHTAYDARATDSTGPVGLRIDAATPVATLSGDRAVTLSPTTHVRFGTALSLRRGSLALAPHAQLEWWPSARLSLSTAASRSVQHVQSLRNSESVVSHMFPVDLYVGASSGLVPSAHSDQASVTAELHPMTGVSLSIGAYARAMRGLLMAAERQSGPFAVASTRDTAFATGTAAVTGAATGFRYESDRVTGLLTYSWQHLRYRQAANQYAPEYAAPHRVEAGVSFEPSPGLTLRIGGIAAFGRHATAVRGAVEWDGCNLADRACEFAGAPQSSPDALGALALPHYTRVDVGVRKRWHRSLYGRDNGIAMYGTITNVFNRTNFLTRSAQDGIRSGVEMRSRAPLVAGMEWQF